MYDHAVSSLQHVPPVRHQPVLPRLGPGVHGAALSTIAAGGVGEGRPDVPQVFHAIHESSQRLYGGARGRPHTQSGICHAQVSQQINIIEQVE